MYARVLNNKFISSCLFYSILRAYFMIGTIGENYIDCRLDRGSILIKGAGIRYVRISRLSPTSLFVTSQIIDVYIAHCGNSTSPCHKEIESRG